VGSVGRIELAIALFLLGLTIGLAVAMRSLIRRFRRRGGPSTHRDEPIQQRPLWLVVLLTILTLGMYLHVWFGQSWSALTRLAGDLDLSPSSHQWAMAMGFDYFARVRAHFQTINEQLALRGLPQGVGPGAAIAMIATFVLIPALVANGQRSLNRIIEHDFGPATERQPTSGEWATIVALTLIYSSVPILYSGF
jgi:hypothetical protein